MTSKQKLKSITETGLAAAMLCVLSPISVPVGDVPLSLATFVILIAAGVLGGTKAALAVVVYLVLGCMGLPVFAGFTGGAGRLLGPTGGFLLGYVLLALIAGRGGGKVLPMILGCAAMYTAGTLWYVFFADVTPWAAMLVCVLPYLPVEAIKTAVAAMTVRRMGR